MAQDAGAALCYPGRLNGLQAVEADCARIKRRNRPEHSKHTSHFSIVPAAGGGIFIPIFFQFLRREVNSMTMVKREVNNIWSRVRCDVDVDDLIFDYEGTHSREDETCSER